MYFHVNIKKLDLELKGILEMFWITDKLLILYMCPVFYFSYKHANSVTIYSSPIKPGDEVKKTVVLRPRKPYYWGRELIATFTSKQIVDIETSADIKVIRQNKDNDSDSD